MLIVFTTVAVLTILALLFWVLRGRWFAAEELETLHRIDTLAFHNLLSETDEQYLRISLDGADYRRLRRSRVRAVQEYLFWMAEDCAVLVAMVHTITFDTPQDRETIVHRAIQQRLISLSLWAVLWIEYMLPSVEIRPQKVLGKYEEFWRLAEKHLARSQPQPTLSPGRG